MKNLFWTTVSKVLAVVTLTLIVAFILAPGAAAAGKYKILHAFTGADGSGAQDGLFVFDGAGNLYGTTAGGGTYGSGNVFMLTPNSNGTWTDTVLYSFGTNSGDPSSVRAGLIFDTGGNLYGTSWSGGAYGYGTVYKLTPPQQGGSWTETVIYSFTGGSDGGWAVGGVIFDASGNLYGPATIGGDDGGGVIFKLTPNPDGTWSETVIHSFTGSDGGFPDHGSLIFDAAGNLYGEASDLFWGPCCGTIFELMPQPDGTWKEQVLHHFTGGADGGTPESTLRFDKAGSLYGTTIGGGAHGSGVVFKLTPGSNGKWKEQILHAFKGTDGAAPFAGVVFDPAGNMYGETLHGGSGPCSDYFGSGCGVVFKLSPNAHGEWTERVLHGFEGKPAGSPYGEVVRDVKGNLYGITSGDGADNGAVFELMP